MGYLPLSLAYANQYLLRRIPRKSEVVCPMRFFTTEKHGLWKQGVKEGGNEERRERDWERRREGGENSSLSHHLLGGKTPHNVGVNIM